MRALYRTLSSLTALSSHVLSACSETPLPPVPHDVDSTVPLAGVIATVSNAPVVGNGDVAGARTDLVIDLSGSLDPAVPGRGLLEDQTIAVFLPREFEFVDPEHFPVRDVFSTPTCVPGNLQCSTAVLLQGWPQQPILPTFPTPGAANRYALAYDPAAHAIVFTALKDIVASVPFPTPPLQMLPGPGIKQIHLLLNGFRNPPRPGRYEIRVRFRNELGELLEAGEAPIQIIPAPRPHIGVTSVFADGNPAPPHANPIYQTTPAGTAAPYPFDFLLWDSDGAPLTDVIIRQVNGARALLVRGERVVGDVSIEAPTGASDQQLMSTGPSVLTSAPITAVPTARLTALFVAGSSPGLYRLTFRLLGGSGVTMYVTAI